MVHPIQAPIARTVTNAMSTRAAMSQILIDSRVGIKRAIMYEIAVTTQMMKISQPIP